jgi:hypothetical protein
MQPGEDADEDGASHRQKLRALIRGPVWQEVVVPILEEKLRTLEEQIAISKATSIEDIRYAQGQHSIWRLLLREPLVGLQRLKREEY